MDRFNASLQIFKECLPATILEGKQPEEKVSIVNEQLQKIYVRISQIEDNSNFIEKNLEATEHAEFHRKKLFQMLEIIQTSEVLENLNLEEKIKRLLDIYMLLCTKFIVDRQSKGDGAEPSVSPNLVEMVCNDSDC